MRGGAKTQRHPAYNPEAARTLSRETIRKQRQVGHNSPKQLLHRPLHQNKRILSESGDHVRRVLEPTPGVEYFPNVVRKNEPRGIRFRARRTCQQRAWTQPETVWRRQRFSLQQDSPTHFPAIPPVRPPTRHGEA